MTDLKQHRREAEQTLGVYCLAASDMVALLDRIERLETALQIFADDENWRYGRRLDPNGSRFDGTEIARRALEPKP